ncbi:Capsular polysaccharide biosynthesis protein [Geodermatophilus obscurus]|uniref:Capsular polysaccharide biosynthesis protein n=1 Tax=Geodermatophilus obscurus TaxID=1861 RepID=A0A1I5DI96_9ACTN|nr:hypothetical protein [Geodermatophilus obscurus]SFN98985.1 Capsular polysaccharide biosynthesis protein [Geodermatophilus obscurus]
MDLFAILSSLRRHLIVTVLVLGATLVGAVALLAFMPRDYRATASYVLVNPLPPPTDEEIAANPSLAQGNRDNPYLRFTSEATVGQVLAGRVNSGTVREALAAQGANPAYELAPSPSSAQIIDVAGTGTSAAEAEATLRLVSERMVQELYDAQTVNGADDAALIEALPVAEPTPASVVLSGTVRSLVGVVGAGVVVLFVTISLAEARDARRRELEAGAEPAEGTPGAGAGAAGPLPGTGAPERPRPVEDLLDPDDADLRSELLDHRPEAAGTRPGL